MVIKQKQEATLVGYHHAMGGDLWETQIKLWDLKKEKLVFCVVDGAANYQAALKNHVIYNI